ncbi:MAG: cyclic nucleotide-binding domain-containing protein [SAR202 cluster bacterium]|nr:cyclic nucleotide-binding domain-containing protein [SAR202 cluster bacterium]
MTTYVSTTVHQNVSTGQAQAATDEQHAQRWVGHLRQCRYFQKFSDVELLQVARLCREVGFARGETVIVGGSRRQVAYLITRGEAGMFFKGSAEEMPLDRVGPGMLLGAFAIISPGTVTGFGFKALADITALRISGREFQQLCEANPKVGYDFASELAIALNRRVYDMYYRLQELR